LRTTFCNPRIFTGSVSATLLRILKESLPFAFLGLVQFGSHSPPVRNGVPCEGQQKNACTHPNPNETGYFYQFFRLLLDVGEVQDFVFFRKCFLFHRFRFYFSRPSF
jgi:hypothetical protein